jgi:hypothetical protein
MPRRAACPVVLAVVVAALLGAAASAPAGTQPTQGTVEIDDCHVRHSRNAGGFTYFYCGITSDIPAGSSGSVTYTVNLPVFKPRNDNGSFRSRTGAIGLSEGTQLWNAEFAVRGRSVAQVRRTLRVTLSNPVGVTISDATAVAAAN